MKKTRALALFLALVMIVAALPMTALAASKTMYVKTNNKNSLNVRVTMKVETGNILTKLSYGTQVKVLSESGSWALINWGSSSKNKGYVMKKYLSSTKPGSGTTSTDTVLGYAYVKTATGVGANMRVGKSGTKIIRVVPEGNKVKVLAKSDHGWTKVSYKNSVGYIYSSLLRTTK